MKRILGMIFVIAIVFVCFSSVSYSENIDSGYTDGMNWTLDDEGILTISGSYMTDTATMYQSPFYSMKDKITKIIISEGMNNIGYDIFNDLENLQTIEIPSTVIRVHPAFYNCTSLTEIIVSPDNATYCSDGGHLFSKDKDALVQYAIGQTASEYTVPDGVIVLENSAFYGCKNLKKITISDDINTISYRTFYGCSNLNEIKLGKNIKIIDTNAFFGCGYYNNNDNWTDMVLYLDNYLLDTRRGGVTGSYTIKDGTTCIAARSFSDYDYQTLTEITIPDSVKYIGRHAFENCKALVNINMGKNVEYIGDDTFLDTAYYRDTDNWDEGLLYVGDCLVDANEDLSGVCRIKDGTRCVGNDTFYNCSNTIGVLIPKSVKFLGDNLWNFSGGDYYIYYTGSRNEWDNIVKGSNTQFERPEEAFIIYYDSDPNNLFIPLELSEYSHGTDYNGVETVYSISVSTDKESRWNDLSNIKMYLAEYDDNGLLMNITEGKNGEVSDGNMTITVPLPIYENNKIMLWYLNQYPLIEAIAEIQTQ